MALDLVSTHLADMPGHDGSLLSTGFSFRLRGDKQIACRVPKCIFPRQSLISRLFPQKNQGFQIEIFFECTGLAFEKQIGRSRLDYGAIASKTAPPFPHACRIPAFAACKEDTFRRPGALARTVPNRKVLGLSWLRSSLSAFMGAGGEAPWKNTRGSGFFLQCTDAFRLKAENQNHYFFPKGAAAPGPRFKTSRKLITTT